MTDQPYRTPLIALYPLNQIRGIGLPSEKCGGRLIGYQRPVGMRADRHAKIFAQAGQQYSIGIRRVTVSMRKQQLHPAIMSESQSFENSRFRSYWRDVT